MTAYAGGGEDSESEPPAATITEPEAPATPNPVSLFPDSNLPLVDDINEQEGDSYKQFITVVTKDGDYFYIIIDRVGYTENVYFLNLVDDTDLFALLEDVDAPLTQPLTPEPEQPTAPEEPEAEPKRGKAAAWRYLANLACAGGGAFYYFKILKPKQTTAGGTDFAELDELDFDDGDDDFMSAGVDELEDDTE